MKFMGHVTAHFFLLVFQRRECLLSIVSPLWSTRSSFVTYIIWDIIAVVIGQTAVYEGCVSAFRLARIANRCDRLFPFVSLRPGVARLVGYSCLLYLRPQFRLRSQSLSVPIYVGPSTVFRELDRTFHVLRLKHKENLLWFILSRTHWLSCIGFCFICSFCMKSSRKRVSIHFYARPTMLVLGGPTTFRGVYNKKGSGGPLPESFEILYRIKSICTL